MAQQLKAGTVLTRGPELDSQHPHQMATITCHCIRWLKTACILVWRYPILLTSTGNSFRRHTHMPTHNTHIHINYSNERMQMSNSKYVYNGRKSFNLWKVKTDKSEDNNLSKIISTRLLTQKIKTITNCISVSQRKNNMAIKYFHWPGREVQACETSLWKTEPGGRPSFFRRQERGKSKEGERKSMKREDTL